MKKGSFRNWLRRRGITLQEFCDTTGIKYTTAGKWRHCGVTNPNEAHVDKVLEVYPDCPLIID